MKNFILCSLTAIFLLLDMLAGNLSLFPALSVYLAVILFLAYNWKYGILCAASSGLVLDAVYGHSFSYLSVIFMLAATAGALTAERGHRQLPGLFAAGAAAGSITAVGIMVAVKVTSGQLPAPDRFSYLFFSAGGGGIYLVLGAMLFDFFAERANLPRCIRNVFTDPTQRRRRPVSRTAATANARRRRP